MVAIDSKIFDPIFLQIITIGGQRPNTLQKVDLPIMENKICQEWYQSEKKTLTIVDTSMCAGYEQGGKDSCQVNTISLFKIQF